jgi:RHS repeat-associated protein
VRTNYAYDTTWKDKLISYGGQTITYDAIGNPLTYRNGMTFTWENGRQLATLQKGTNTVQYTYDINGIRTQKVSTEGTTKYYYNDSNQLIMANVPSQYGENIMRFYYDENGTPAHVKLARTKANGTTENLRYGYVTNLQGDVVGISDCSGVLRANYEYDAWGKLLSVKDADGNTVTDKSNIALLNPLRYRGYVYDTDSGLYYLQSRYYDPVTGRFINADALEMMLLSDNILGTNLFAYCNDNPVMYSDPMGQQPRWAWAVNRFAKHTTLYKSFLYATIHGWFSSLFWIAGFFRDSKGIYHARQDCWQQFFGYNAFYDWAFDIGTSMLTKNFKFNYGNKEYIFWAWKGDYLNLGAGAELGIYSRLVIRGKSTGHWLAETKLAMPMTLTLKYKGRTIASYKPKQKQWWITSFSPYFQNVKASALQVVFTINFSSQKGLFNAFYSKTKNKPGWKFNTKKYTATFTF